MALEALPLVWASFFGPVGVPQDKLTGQDYGSRGFAPLARVELRGSDLLLWGLGPIRVPQDKLLGPIRVPQDKLTTQAMALEVSGGPPALEVETNRASARQIERRRCWL